MQTLHTRLAYDARVKWWISRNPFVDIKKKGKKKVSIEACAVRDKTISERNSRREEKVHYLADYV